MNRTCACLTVAALQTFAHAARAACPVDTLAWLAGSWSGVRNGVLEEEHWTAPRASIMVGMNWTRTSLAP